MAYEAKIVAGSIADTNEVPLTTIQATYPRFVHAELLTHRVFSRNSASSRAIPVETMHRNILQDPVMPVWWGKNQRGMQAREELEDYNYPDGIGNDEYTKDEAQAEWLHAMRSALSHAGNLHQGGKGLHKQIVNRLTEPWMWITVVITSTEWENFFNLRCHPDAQPEIKRIAEMMKEAYESHYYYYEKGEPLEDTYHAPIKRIKEGEWHLPYWGMEGDENYEGKEKEVRFSDGTSVILPTKVLISAGRTARVSYLTHEGERDPEKDIELAVDRLLHPENMHDPGHWSPWEHQAQPFTQSRMALISELSDTVTLSYHGRNMPTSEINEIFDRFHFSGNLRGWVQARKKFAHESGLTL